MALRFALFSDVHSNAVALRACLARLRELEGSGGEPFELVVAGDTLNAGPDPVDTLALLCDASKVHLVGNHEEYLARYLEEPNNERFSDPLWRFVPWTAARIGHEVLRGYLETLQPSHHFEDYCCRIHHASPHSTSRVPEWFPEQNKAVAHVPPPYSGRVEEVVLVGHSHYSALHFRRGFSELWVNTGSIGYPFVARPNPFEGDPLAVFPHARLVRHGAELGVVVEFEQVTYSASELIESYARSGALFGCAPYSLAILCQSLFNLDVTWPAFHEAKRHGIPQEQLAQALYVYMERTGLLAHLERRLVEVLGGGTNLTIGCIS
jgi:hypothetical protein